MAVASNASSRTPVADTDTVSGFQIGVVIIGISITLPLLYSAGELAQGIGLLQGTQAVVIGGLILSVMAVPASIVGVKTRLSSYMIVEHTFGFAGAKLVNFWFGVFLLGWYAVTAELFGRTLFLAANELANIGIDEWVYTVLSSALVTVTTVYGFKAIDRLALIAVPLLLLALIAVVVLALQKTTLAAVVSIEASGIDLWTAISAVVGAAIVGVVLMPDLTRYARNVRDCVTASFLGQGLGIVIVYVIGMIPVLVFGENEPMNYMLLMGFGALALAVIVFATWTTNVINLYGVALAARASVPIGSYRGMTLIGGVLGTIAAVVGIADHLIEFLIVLGLLVPPIAGIYLCDFFLLGRRDYSAQHLETRPAVRVNALIVGIGAGLVATWLYFADKSLTAIAPLDSLLLSVVAYLAIERLTATFGKRAKSRS